MSAFLHNLTHTQQSSSFTIGETVSLTSNFRPPTHLPKWELSSIFWSLLCFQWPNAVSRDQRLMIRMFMMMMMFMMMSLRENGTRHRALPTSQQHKPWLKTFFPAPLSTTPRQRIKYFTFLFFIYFMKCIIINSTPSQGKIALLLIRQTSNIRSLSDFKHGNLSLTGCKLFFDYRSETDFLQSDNSTLTSSSQNGERIFKDRTVS